MARISGNESSFATAVLDGLGAPVTQSNIDFIERWITREGGGGANNPLNTTQQMSGSTVLAGNSAGVQNYGSLDTGVQATIKTLLNGYYPNIVAALKAGNASEADSAGQLAQDLSTWSGGGYSTVANVTPRPSNSIGSTSNPAGGASSGAGRAGSSANAVYGNIDGFLQSQAPALAAELSDPAVKSLLQRWGSGQLSDQQFQNQLEQTAWWKNTPQSQRQLLVSQATDPATVKQNLDNQAASVWALANQMGVALNAGQVSAIAEASITGQWSSQQVKENIASHFQTAGQDIGGEAATDTQALKALYAQYALPPGDPVSLQRQVQQLLSTGQSVNSFAQQLAQQAKSLYGGNPDLAAALDRGETVSQFMQPYANVASQRLGVDPNEIDWTQPKWNAALTGTTDPGSGRTTPMSLMQWQRTIMTDPTYGWAQSQDGISQATHGAQVIAQGLGLNVA